MRIETDVLIIGGGVAGSAMAACLTDKGYNCLLYTSPSPRDQA